MSLFLAFGLNFGNIRKGPRRPMDELVRGWNDHWKSQRAAAHVVDWYRPSGNFVLELGHGGITEAIESFRGVEPTRRFAVFTIETFKDWLVAVRRAAHRPPESEPNVRWTPGVVMDSDPDGSEPRAPTRVTQIHFGPEVRPRLMMVWKRDQLLPGREKLDPDPKARGGGWGSVAVAMGSRQRWTARSLGTVEGLYAVARAKAPRCGSLGIGASSREPSKGTARRSDEPVAPPHALLIVRRDAERLARDVCARAGLDVAGKRFVEVCALIEQARVLNAKALVYLHALRRLGNLAAHPETGLDFSGGDREVAHQLLRLLEEEARP